MIRKSLLLDEHADDALNDYDNDEDAGQERDKVNLAGFHFNLAAAVEAAAAQRQNKEKRQNEFCNV